eukprot:2656531-Amphidinium_carterae.1
MLLQTQTAGILNPLEILSPTPTLSALCVLLLALGCGTNSGLCVPIEWVQEHKSDGDAPMEDFHEQEATLVVGLDKT